MLPLGFAMLIVGGITSLAGITGSTIHSVVQGKPDRANSGGLGSGGGGTAAPSTSTSTPEATKSQSAVRKQIVQFFMSKGLSKAQASGIAGNAQQESSLNPQDTGGGLFQDIGARAASGTGTLQQQLQATWAE